MSGVTSTNPARDRRWIILGVIALAQLMVVLDLTVMNIALPSAQRAQRFTTADRQWVVTAYTLAFGSLLLLGGRLADLLGRKVTFLTGLAGFAVVSAIGGASVNFAMLVTARACQGAFAALLVPSALSPLTTTFTEPKDRGRAFGVFGAIAGAGGAIGLLLGGALFCLVYGFSNAAAHGWAAPSTYGFLAAGVLLAVVFAAWQGRAAHPLLPPRVVLDRNRGGASIGTSLLNTIFASPVASYLAAHLGAAALIGRPALAALALAHGYDTAFWWVTGIFAGGAIVGGALLRSGPLTRQARDANHQSQVTTGHRAGG
jgi:MFS family permease